MRKPIAILIVGTCLILGALIVPARVADTELSRQDAKSIATTPVSERDGKNVALSVEVKPDTPKKLPRGIGILANGRPLDLLDEGNWPDERAGDGIYTIAAKTKDGKPLKEKSSARIRPEQNSHHATASLMGFSCTFLVVTCPANCRSALFGSKCVVCVQLQSCDLGF